MHECICSYKDGCRYIVDNYHDCRKALPSLNVRPFDFFQFVINFFICHLSFFLFVIKRLKFDMNTWKYLQRPTDNAKPSDPGGSSQQI